METEEELLADTTQDENGELQTLTFSWMKKGNEKHRSWDNTILGNIAIEDGKLMVDVNSEKRSETIRTEIAERLGHHQLKITLKGSDPPIWRRVVVRPNIPLSPFMA